MRGKPNSVDLRPPRGVPVSVVNATMSPLPSLTAELRRRFPRKALGAGVTHCPVRRHHTAAEITQQSFQPTARNARTASGEPGLSHISLSSGRTADWAHGVLYTDGQSFTGRQNLLRQPHLLPALLPATKYHTSDSAQTISLDEPSSPSSPQLFSPQLPGTPATIVSTTADAQEPLQGPGEGVNASAADMLAYEERLAQKWGLVRQSVRSVGGGGGGGGDPTRKRKTSTRKQRAYAQAQGVVNSFQLNNASTNAPVPCMVKPATVLKMLSSIPWFKSLSSRTLHKMLTTGSLVFFPRGSLIVRESSYGSCFYVLLDGLVGISSVSKRIDVRMDTAGAFFGEAALAPDVHVRREASVVALEDVWCFRLTADHMQEMQVDLEPLKKIYIAKLLSRAHWFDMLTVPKLAQVGQLMEVETVPANRSIFEEGDIAERMYIVVSGRVSIFKRKQGDLSTNAKGAHPSDETWAARNMHMADFSPGAKSPWFGEVALFNRDSAELGLRTANAFTVETTQLLSVHASQAKKLYELIPAFFKMNVSANEAYDIANQLNGTSSCIAPDAAEGHTPARASVASNKPSGQRQHLPALKGERFSSVEL